MNGRNALFRHVQAFFETKTVGLFTLNDVGYFPAEKAEKVAPGEPKRRKYAFGRVREIVQFNFGDYTMKVESPHEAPPLGRVELRWPTGSLEGPIDEATFERAGNVVRARGEQPERMTV